LSGDGSSGKIGLAENNGRTLACWRQRQSFTFTTTFFRYDRANAAALLYDPESTRCDVTTDKWDVMFRSGERDTCTNVAPDCHAHDRFFVDGDIIAARTMSASLCHRVAHASGDSDVIWLRDEVIPSGN